MKIYSENIYYIYSIFCNICIYFMYACQIKIYKTIRFVYVKEFVLLFNILGFLFETPLPLYNLKLVILEIQVENEKIIV